MNNPSQAPCKGCNEREVGCHMSCEKYSEYKGAWDDIRKKRDMDRRINGYETDRVLRSLSRLGGRERAKARIIGQP